MRKHSSFRIAPGCPYTRRSQQHSASHHARGISDMHPSVQIMRELVPPLARWVSNNRVTMSLLNNGTLIIIVWIQLCAAHTRLFQQPFQDIVLIIVGAILLHFVFVAINWPIVAYVGLPSLHSHNPLCSKARLPPCRPVLFGTRALSAHVVVCSTSGVSRRTRAAPTSPALDEPAAIGLT